MTNRWRLMEKGILAGKKFTLQKSEFTLQRRFFQIIIQLVVLVRHSTRLETQIIHRYIHSLTQSKVDFKSSFLFHFSNQSMAKL
jgi:hypothetical protein